jgi:hypothetical protein
VRLLLVRSDITMETEEATALAVIIQQRGEETVN